MVKSPRSRSLPQLFLLLSMIAGCGPGRPPTAAVSGIVTLDGAPLSEAGVMFHPEAGGQPAAGVTDAEGKFRLSTFEEGDGALLGKHRVTVAKMEIAADSAGENMLEGATPPQQTWLVPQEYANNSTSGLSAVVEKGKENAFTFTLTSEGQNTQAEKDS